MKFSPDRVAPPLIIMILAGGLAYGINHDHPNRGVDDYVKLVSIWFTLFGVMYTGWLTMRNTDRQIAATKQLATDQQTFTTRLETLRNDFQKDMESFKRDLALELEEAKIKFAQRYTAQAGLTRAAMIAVDRINRLQTGSSIEGEIISRMSDLEDALQQMDAQRGTLLMMPKGFRITWEAFAQHATYITGRLKEDVSAHRSINLRDFFAEDLVGRKSIELWYEFEKEATFDYRTAR
jgi:hypothetical protein